MITHNRERLLYQTRCHSLLRPWWLGRIKLDFARQGLCHSGINSGQLFCRSLKSLLVLGSVTSSFHANFL